MEITLHQRGRPNAQLVQVLLENHSRFLSFVQRRVGSRTVAEDILQSALAKGLEGLANVRDAHSVVTWFYRLLRNSITDHFRHHAADVRAVRSLEAADTGDGTGDPGLRLNICRCIAGLLETLKPEYAAILQQVELAEVRLAAFAREQGITPNNATVRLHRAREALRGRLLVACGACARHGCLECTCRRPARPQPGSPAATVL